MATRSWLGRAAATAQVDTFTPGSVSAGDTFTITINTKAFTFTSTDGTVAEVCTGLVALLQASTDGDISSITWADNTTTITGTASTPGVPFTATSSSVGGTLSRTATVANSSPNSAGIAANWSASTLPVSGDSIIIEATDVSLLWDLDAFAAVDIVSCTVASTFVGQIGLPLTNELGYYEYRPTELQFQTCTTLIEEQAANLQPGQRKYFVGANACAATFYGQGQGTLGQEVTWWRGTHASNTLTADGASVVVAYLDSTTATIATVSAVNSTLTFGVGVGTVTTLSATDCSMSIQSAVTTCTLDGASSQATMSGTMTVGTLNLYAGNLTYMSSGTVTTLLLGTQTNPATVDYSMDRRARTITNLVNAYAGSTFNDPDGTVTLSAGIKVPNGRIGDITLVPGVGKTYTLS